MTFEDVIMLAAMGPPGGGRSFITQRVIRHSNVLGYTELDQKTVKQIFATIVTHFLRRFQEQVKNMCDPLVDAVMFVYNTVRTELLPTPSKSHYTFNLRDIWKVFQGVCSANPKATGEPALIVKLWFNENMHVFHDRLTTEEDRQYLVKLLVSQFQSQFNMEQEQILDVERVIFGDFM